MPQTVAPLAKAPGTLVAGPLAEVHPKVAFRDLRFLESIRAAHGFNHWGEAARAVLIDVARDPSDPVRWCDFQEGDVPLPSARSFRGGFASALDPTICVQLPTATLDALLDLTRDRGFKTADRAIAAILCVARINDDGRRYRPAVAE